jgi:serine/threonine protein kinase
MKPPGRPGSLLSGGVIGLVWLAISSTSAIADPVVQTLTGEVVGSEAGPLSVFRGIPYAAPPVGPLRWREAVDLGIRIGGALESLHGEGLVHGDVSPANVFLREGRVGSPCLLDLHASPRGGWTDISLPVTVAFMDPPYPLAEQSSGRRRILEQCARLRASMADGGWLVLRLPYALGEEERSIAGFRGPEIRSFGDMHVHLYVADAGVAPDAAAGATDSPEAHG